MLETRLLRLTRTSATMNTFWIISEFHIILITMYIAYDSHHSIHYVRMKFFHSATINFEKAHHSMSKRTAFCTCDHCFKNKISFYMVIKQLWMSLLYRPRAFNTRRVCWPNEWIRCSEQTHPLWSTSDGIPKTCQWYAKFSHEMP